MRTARRERAGRTRRRGWAALARADGAALAVALGSGRVLGGHQPVWIAAWADVAATLTVFAFSAAHDNSSLYDPYWSVAPVPIVVYWARAGGGGLNRLAAFAFGRLLPRRTSIRIMERATRRLYE